MLRPSTVATLAVLVCLPALVVFASGNLSVEGLLIWYLVALVGVSVGAFVLGRIWSVYGTDDRESDSSADR